MQLPDEAKQQGAAPHWLAYVATPDIDARVETITQLGGQVLNGPMDVPGGDRVAQCLDPQGVAFAIHSTAKTSS
jgi:predicted enzyme related to lactoylglutathione lyase